MGYFFVKHYGESTSENPLLHWIDEDYKLYDHRLHRWTQIFLERELPGLFPTDNTDGHRFFLNNGLRRITRIARIIFFYRNYQKLTMRSALVTLCLQRIIRNYNLGKYY